MKKIKNILALSVILSSMLFLSSCVKKDFDEPETANEDPALTPTKTIATLQALATVSGVPVLISSDEIIDGVVIADDLSGNFYKEMIIQDATAGISIQVDMSNFNTIYPIGRRVFVKCKGLYVMKDIDNNYQIGMYDIGQVARIPQTLVPQYLVPGMWGVNVVPRQVSLYSLISAPSNTLVQVNDVQFNAIDTGKTYANSATLQSHNATIEDCCSHTVSLYNSGYSNFASQLMSSAHGSVTAVFKLYAGAGELVIRNTDDVKMTAARCSGSGTLTVGTGALMTIGEVRNLYTGCDASFAAGTKVRGTVISDKANGNINASNLVMQDTARGVLVRFLLSADNTFAVNDSIEINLSGFLLTSFQNNIEINNVTAANVTVLGTGTVVPRVATVSEVFANQNDWESMLVKIVGVTLTGGTAGNYSGSVNMNDGTGALILYTRSGATFSGTAYPTTSVTVTSYITRYFATPENVIRSAADVQ